MSIYKTYGDRNYELVGGRRGIRFVPFEGVIPGSDTDAPTIVMTSADSVSDETYIATVDVTDASDITSVEISLDGGTTWLPMSESP